MDKLPIYELKIDELEDSIVDAIAQVEHPAIESDFLAFNDAQAKQLSFLNDEKRELIGAAMIPDMKIYRQDNDGKEYYVYFSKETIRQIAQVFFKKGFQHNINLDHTEKGAGSYVFQSYIVDEAKGINAPKGLDVPDGSWIVGMKVEDDEVWSDIKAGKRRGFSVEGVFQLLKTEFNTKHKNDDKDTVALLTELLSKHIKQSKDKRLMTLYQKLKELFTETFAEEVPAEKIHVTEMALGGKVEMVQDDGSLAPAPDGEYTVDENTFTVKGGFIVELNGEKSEDRPAEVEQPKEEPVEAAEEPAQEETPAHESNDVAQMKEMCDAMQAEIDGLKQAVAALQDAIAQKDAKEAEMSAQFNSQLTELNNTLKQLAKMPAEFSKTNNSNRVKDAREEKLMEFAKNFGRGK